MIGECLNNRYQIQNKIGDGGMALVYEAKDQLLNRTVAIKVLRPQFGSDEDFIDRFKREAQAVANFSHPNIVNIFDIGKDGTTHYIVMENVKGKTLKKKIEKENKIDPYVALEITKQVCEALVVAHKKNIVHCDIKPANILLTPAGRPKLTDFGIARALTSATLKYTETVIGSAHYLAPEQARGGKVDKRTDIYSLGVVLYEMVAGEVPFEGETPVTVALKHIKESPVSPGKLTRNIPQAIENIILKCLNKEPQSRYNSAKEMLVACKKALNGEDTADTQEFVLDEEKEDWEEKTIVMKSDDYPVDNLSEEPDWKKRGKKKAVEETIEEETTKEEVEKTEKSQQDRIGENTESQPQPEMNSNTSFWQRNRKLMIGVLIFVLLAGSLAWGYYQVMDFLHVPIVKVPDVTDKKLETAKKELDKKGLTLEVYDQKYNNQVPEDHIISQYPKAEKEVKQAREISVTVSKGAKLTEVPKLIGQTLREAKVALDEADLEVGKVNYVFNDQIKKGLTINQDPAPGKEAKIGAEVELIISKGEKAAPVEVPNLIGLSEENAKKRLRDLDLIIGEIEYKESLNYFEGQVMEQEPKPSAKSAAGSPVNLVVSKGIRNVQNSEIHEFDVRVNINPGQKDQRVKISVKDDNGRRIIYNELHHPGDLVEKKVISVGPTVVRVYINGSLIREQRL